MCEGDEVMGGGGTRDEEMRTSVDKPVNDHMLREDKTARQKSRREQRCGAILHALAL